MGTVGTPHSPIWDCATSVEVLSQRGEKGSPSSASLSPWGETRLRLPGAGAQVLVPTPGARWAHPETLGQTLSEEGTA